jgi:hypothetical protein
MSHHRIFGSEADQPRPLAYVSMFRPQRRRYRGYVAAAVIGGTLMLAAAVLVVLTGASLSGAVR